MESDAHGFLLQAKTQMSEYVCVHVSGKDRKSKKLDEKSEKIEQSGRRKAIIDAGLLRGVTKEEHCLHFTT